MDEKGLGLDVHREHHEMLPVWFFVGVLLLFYGIVIAIVGVRDYVHPPAVVLASYHADLWGGFVLILLGGGFTAQSLRSRMASGRKRTLKEDRALGVTEYAVQGKE